MQRLDRTTFKTKRGAEYLDRSDLERMTGQSWTSFGAILLKELLDNGLDAAELVGVPPDIVVDVEVAGDDLMICVEDNAGGIPAETIAGILDFDVYASDKRMYQSPTRGQQGNAWKVILGIPYALAGSSCSPVVITNWTEGIQHTIRVTADPAGGVSVDHDESEAGSAPPTKGTRVVVRLPKAGQLFEPELWIRSFALYNPHATIQFSYHGKHDSEGVEKYKTTQETFNKFLPTAATSACWYDAAALEQLIYAHIGDARNGRRDLPLGAFIEQFRDLKRTDRRKRVAASLENRVRRLSDFASLPERDRRAAISTLLEAMQKESRPPPHKVLGRVNAAHFEERFDELYGVERFWYNYVEGDQDGIPYIFEVALAEVERPGQLFTAINYSPTFQEPFARTLFSAQEAANQKDPGVEAFLKSRYARPYESTWAAYDENNHPEQLYTAVATHFISPVPRYLEPGKSTLDTKGL
jgi:DNA topoisomerase VI subunit B